MLPRYQRFLPIVSSIVFGFRLSFARSIGVYRGWRRFEVSGRISSSNFDELFMERVRRQHCHAVGRDSEVLLTQRTRGAIVTLLDGMVKSCWHSEHEERSPRCWTGWRSPADTADTRSGRHAVGRDGEVLLIQRTRGAVARFLVTDVVYRRR